MSPKLVVASGKSAGRAIALKREKLLVGRADECDIRPLSEQVSRRHCQFFSDGDKFFVEDLRSRNGTFVNGVRVEGRRELADGEIVRIGNLELKVVCRPAEKSASSGSDAAATGAKIGGAAASTSGGDDEEVSRWLMADEEPSGMFDTTRAMRVADDATVPISPEASSKDDTAKSGKPPEDSSATVVRGRPSPGGAAGGHKKSADTSRAAAAEALKKFFGNR